MPSARAARTAGAMMRISSSPNRPPSPACGFSPATAMRGRSTDPSRRQLRCAMRSVSSTASKVTASIAARSDRWIVTSTVRSSSLASIMRTGGGRPGDASACSISVWPGNPMPAAASASLWIGAVTMPATAPPRASSTACSMQRAAAAPARASTLPERRLEQIGRQPGRRAAPACSRAARRRGRRRARARRPRAGRQSPPRPAAAPPGRRSRCSRSRRRRGTAWR